MEIYDAETRDDVVDALNNGGIQCLNGNDEYESPLVFHGRENNIDVVIALIEFGCDITVDDNKGYNILMILCSKGHSELLERVLKYDHVRSLINFSSEDRTPLIIASMKGFTDIFDILILNGADPNVYADDRSALYWACAYDNVDIVERLLNMDIDINHRSKSGSSAIFLCISVEVLNRLFIYGADINLEGNFGFTPLLRFIDDEDNLAEALINLGANINVPEYFHHRPIIQAIKHRKIHLVKLLLERGADVMCNGLTKNFENYLDLYLTRSEKIEILSLYHDLKS